MRAEPDDIKVEDLAEALWRGWRLRVDDLHYEPVGSGSHHWIAQVRDSPDHFVSVDPIGTGDGAEGRTVDDLERAFATALALRSFGLEFVAAPLQTVRRSMLWTISFRYVVSVRTVVHGAAGEFGPHRAEDVGEVLSMLARLHGAPASIVSTAPTEDLRIPRRNSLIDALASAGGVEWSGGPFSRQAQEALSRGSSRVVALLARLDGLADEIGRSGWTVTHGEPHPGNIIRSSEGLRLIDWDTVGIAPRERDLWFVSADVDHDLEGYSEVSGYWPGAPCLEYYRLRWRATNIAMYADRLRKPHAAEGDAMAALEFLSHHLEDLR